LRKREAGTFLPLKGLGLGTRPPPVRGESTPENKIKFLGWGRIK
jgi:hypothetical protein